MTRLCRHCASFLAPLGTPKCFASLRRACGFHTHSFLCSHLDEGDELQAAQPIVVVEVMNSLAHRDRLFGSDVFPFDEHRPPLFVWSGATSDGAPFTRDASGSRLMQFLVLVADWEKDNLAESLFSAIGVRVVDVLH